MESPFLRRRTDILGARMTVLDSMINRLINRTSLCFLFYIVGLPLVLSRSSYITFIALGMPWMPLALAIIMFYLICFYLDHNLRLLWIFSTEMEGLAAELNENRQRLLDLGMEHDAFSAEKAGTWAAVPAWTIRIWGIVIVFCVVVLSIPLLYVEFKRVFPGFSLTFELA
ncbi:hypothetical protein ACJRO7_017671 [Eucalyptus globulus]|uniref:Uncharacterized protein n=1 Tax=Eucalyptus globulus TaxID=34317 RepID=A0ABD3KVD8_EUCGL